MGYEKHLFISYAHIDNEPIAEEKDGWVTRFHASLAKVLSMRLGKKVEIWRDFKLNGNDIFAEEIVAQFPNTELMVSVVSPRYVESDWCTREAREFCKAAEQAGGLIVDHKARIIKVIKLPADSEDKLPEIMKQTLGYAFYVLDDQQTPLELDPAYGAEYAQKYNLKVAKLAFDLSQFIKKVEVEPAKGGSGEAAGGWKPAIYLAECSFEGRDEREAIESDLKRQGYTVYPDKPLPRDEAAYVAEVRLVLGRCQLAIHLIGSRHGFVPDGPDEKSAVQLQNEQGVERAKAGGLSRLIWLPQGTKSESHDHQAFIDSLLQNQEAQFAADVITGSHEAIKEAVRAALKKLEAEHQRVPAETSTSKLVYLVCNERDRKATIPVRKFLQSCGLECEVPVFEGDPAEVRKANQELLAECDSVLLFYGAGDEAWKRSIDAELRKAPSYRAGKPWTASYTYLSEPATEDKKELIDLEESNLIDGLSGFSTAAFEPFTRALQARPSPSAEA